MVPALTSRDLGDDALRLAGWQKAGLPKPTWPKPLVGTLSSGVIVRRLGRLAPGNAQKIPAVLARLLTPEFLPPGTDG